jgi:hypothetical protein
VSPAEALWVIEYDDTSWTQQMRAWGALVGIPLEELPTNWHRRTLRHLEDTSCQGDTMAKKPTPPKRRNVLTLCMLQRYRSTTTTHPDRKKRANKRACRGPVKEDK